MKNVKRTYSSDDLLGGIDGGGTAATSTSLGAMLLHAVVISAIEQMMEKGHIPEVFSLSNLDEGMRLTTKSWPDIGRLLKLYSCYDETSAIRKNLV